MTAVFTPVYLLAVSKTLMEMSAAPEHGHPVNLAGGRGTRIPDLRLLLAMHSARQATGPTVRIVREGDLMVAAGDEPARLILIFGQSEANPSARRKAAGSFNERVAAHIAVGIDSEGKIYSGG
jgi:hypothetical protein